MSYAGYTQPYSGQPAAAPAAYNAPAGAAAAGPYYYAPPVPPPTGAVPPQGYGAPTTTAPTAYPGTAPAAAPGYGYPAHTNYAAAPSPAAGAAPGSAYYQAQPPAGAAPTHYAPYVSPAWAGAPPATGTLPTNPPLAGAAPYYAAAGSPPPAMGNGGGATPPPPGGAAHQPFPLPPPAEHQHLGGAGGPPPAYPPAAASGPSSPAGGVQGAVPATPSGGNGNGSFAAPPPPTGAVTERGATPPPAGTAGTPAATTQQPAQQQQQPARRARPRKTPNKIDSSQVPTPARDLPVASPAQPRPVINTMKGYAPLSITHYLSQDDGSASAKFMRPTLHATPHDESFLKDSSMPWSVVLSPLFADFESDEERPPLVSGRAPTRCVRCRSYMTAHTTFIELGKRWNCLFCGMVNDTEADYFCNLDSYGRRRDALEKPELCRGSVEYDVNGLDDYALRPDGKTPVAAKPMHHVILVDVSRSMAGAVSSVCDSLRSLVRDMAVRTPRCKISFVTYAETIQFYNFSLPSMPELTVPDVDAPFVPLPFTLLSWMNVAADADRIEEFLDRLAQLPLIVNEEGCASGAAIKCASMILAECGGKVIMTASQAPNLGLGAVAKRDVAKLYKADTEKQLFKPVDGFWPTMAADCARKQISVDIITFPTQYCELVTYSALPHLTGGTLSHFANFNAVNDVHRLHSALARALVEEAGYAAIVRIRCSPGIRINGYHGHFASQDPQDMDLAGVTASHTFVVDLKHEAKIDAKGYSYLQLAMLYTTRNGDRRVRVHTLRTTVCNTHASLFRNADLEATMVSLLFHGVHEAVNKGTKAARDWLTQSVLSILVSYRRHCASSTHTGQLLLPEQLKLMPLYALCAMKSDALIDGSHVSIDDRAQSMFDLMSMPVKEVLHYLYPRLYALQTTLNHQCSGKPREDGVAGVYMPPLQQLTTDTIMCHGMYALLDVQVNLLYIWVGSAVSPRVAAALLGGESDATKIDLSSFEAWHERVRAILQQLAAEGLARMVIIHEGSGGLEDAFFRCMLEDEAVTNGQSYSEFLCYLHKAINLKLA